MVLDKEAENLTRVGEEVVAVGPRQRLDTPGAQSVCRESLQTTHLDHNSLHGIDLTYHQQHIRVNKPEPNLAKFHPFGAHSTFFAFQPSLLGLSFKPQ